MPCLCLTARGTLMPAIIERYKRRECSVEEALIEMYLAGVSVRRVEDITHDNLRLDIVTLIFKSSPFGELLNINNSQKFDNFTAIVC